MKLRAGETLAELLVESLTRLDGGCLAWVGAHATPAPHGTGAGVGAIPYPDIRGDKDNGHTLYLSHAIILITPRDTIRI